jgi:hypothetical protein
MPSRVQKIFVLAVVNWPGCAGVVCVCVCVCAGTTQWRRPTEDNTVLGRAVRKRGRDVDSVADLESRLHASEAKALGLLAGNFPGTWGIAHCRKCAVFLPSSHFDYAEWHTRL